MVKITRRQFLKKSATIGAYACCAAAYGRIGAKNVFAQSLGGSGRTLVLINQFGGADPLHSFSIPYSVSAYYDRRPTIAIAAGSLLNLNGAIGMNTALGGGTNSIHDLFLNGDVVVVQGTGDPRNTQSHFTAQEHMSRGIVAGTGVSDGRGWIGRLGDLYFQDAPFNTFGINVGQLTDFNSSRTTNRPVVTPSLGSYSFSNDSTPNPTGADFSRDNQYRRQVARALLSSSGANSTERKRSVRLAQQAFHDGTVTVATVNAQTVGTFPGNSPGPFLRDTARIVRYGLGTKVCYGGVGGWDDHADLVNSQAGNLARLNAAVQAFATDMKTAGKWNDVVICIFSEFGRNTYENASGGTDHGWGGTMLLIGGAVQGGVLGVTPSDTQIRTKEWINVDIDFRSVFSRLVTWLGYNPVPVFPESYTDTPMTLFA
jgi:uncharacterized protein (DUF1501 family)